MDEINPSKVGMTKIQTQNSLNLKDIGNQSVVGITGFTEKKTIEPDNIKRSETEVKEEEMKKKFSKEIGISEKDLSYSSIFSSKSNKRLRYHLNNKKNRLILYPDDPIIVIWTWFRCMYQSLPLPIFPF